MRLSPLAHWRPQRLLWTYLVSFLLIFILPVFVLTANWLNREWQDQRTEQTAQQERTLRAMTTEIDDAVNHMLVTTNQMALDHALAPTNQEYSAVRSVTAALARYDLSSPLINKIFVYLTSQPDVFFAADGTYDVAPTMYKYGILAGRAGVKAEQNLLHTLRPQLLYTPTANPERGQLTLAVPITAAPGAHSRGTAFYVLNTTAVREQLQAAAPSANQTLALVVGQGRITAKPVVAGKSLPQSTRWSAWQALTKENRLTVTRQAGQGRLFNVVSVTPKPSPWPPLLSLLVQYAWLFAALLVGGGLLSWYLSRRQYVGIRRLAAIVPGTAAQPVDLPRLAAAMRAVITDQRTLAAQEQVRLPFVRNQVLAMLVNGRLADEQTVQRLLNLAQVHFFHPRFLVGILPDTPALAEKVLGDPVVAAAQTVYFIHPSDQAQLIVLVNDDGQTPPAAVLGAVQAQLGSAPMFAGRSVTTPTALHDAYIEAVTAQMTNRPRPGETVSFYQDQGALQLFDAANELKLTNALAQGNSVMAQEAFVALFNQASQNWSPTARFDLPMANLISQILKADYHKNRQVNTALVQQLLAAPSFSVLYALLRQTVHALTAAAPAPVVKDNGAELQTYIAAHASDPTLSLVDVADHFNLSVPYASRHIKEITGMTFTTYVQDIRMERIQTALETTDIPIKDIVTANGYYDVANFTRKFKKLLGVTPGQYRQLHKKPASAADDGLVS